MILTDCPNYDKFEAENFDKIRDEVREMNITYFPFLVRMGQLFDFPMDSDSLYNMVNVYEIAGVDRFLGRPLPQGFSDQDYLNVKHLANWYYYVAMSGNNGFMVNTNKGQKILQEFDLRVSLGSRYQKRWSFIFGHDTDILALHMALNISSAQCTE